VPPEPYRIIFAATARRNLQRLPQAVVWACLEFIDGPITQNPDGSANRWNRIDEDTHTVEILRIDRRAAASTVRRPCRYTRLSGCGADRCLLGGNWRPRAACLSWTRDP
jgi:mRNA-degrading endonuclease RelE of RelBE toxin-antitoxin system